MLPGPLLPPLPAMCLVLGEGASGDGESAKAVDAATFGVADVWPGPAVAANGLIAADGAGPHCGGRSKDIQSAPIGPVIRRVVAAADLIAGDGGGGDGGRCLRENASTTCKAVAAIVTALSQVAADRAVADRRTTRGDVDAAAVRVAGCRWAGTRQAPGCR